MSATHIPSLRSQADLITPMAIRVAATLVLADHIATGLRTAEQLAPVVAIDVAILDRLLRHLANVDVLALDDDGSYALTELGETLLDDHPSRTRRRLDIEGSLGRADLAMVELLGAVRGDSSAFETRYGRSFWDDVSRDPQEHARYDALMAADAADWATQLADAYDWGALGSLTDVGGGDGTVLLELLRRFPSLRGRVIDQPPTVARATQAFQAAGLGDRAHAIGGDFFETLPGEPGAYLLCAIVHDWDDAAATRILGRCAAAAGTSGKVLVVEKVGAGGELPDSSMDLRMLVYFGAAERGVADIASLAEAAGLELRSVDQANDLAVIEFEPRS